MKKKIRLIFYFLIVSSAVFAQQKSNKEWLIKVVDAGKNVPMPHATISVNSKRYFATNDKGELNFKAAYLKDRDTIRISSIGYVSKVLIIKGAIGVPTLIKLAQDNKLLDEVTIISNSKKKGRGALRELLLGNPKTLTKNIGMSGHLSFKYALYVPNSLKTKGFIKELMFYTTNVNPGILSPFKVTVYSSSAKEIYPDKPLIDDDIIVFNSEKSKQVNVSVAKYNIEIPENGFFIVAEIFSNEYYSSNINWDQLPGFAESVKKDQRSFVLGNEDKNWLDVDDFNFCFAAKVLGN